MSFFARTIPSIYDFGQSVLRCFIHEATQMETIGKQATPLDLLSVFTAHANAISRLAGCNVDSDAEKQTISHIKQVPLSLTLSSAVPPLHSERQIPTD